MKHRHATGDDKHPRSLLTRGSSTANLRMGVRLVLMRHSILAATGKEASK